jgi:hypothetical protein
MKTKTIYALTGLVTILSVARVDAATIFAPTDGNTNFLAGNLTGAQLAMFDDSDQSYGGSSLAVQLGDQVGFVGGLSDFVATNASNNPGSQTLTLTGSDNFILGLSIDNGASWLADSSVVSAGINAYTVSFASGNNVIQVDVQVIPAIPVPAAVWLFGSGLLGLIGIARRKALVV